MKNGTVTRRSRAFVATGVGFVLAWQLAVVTGLGRPATVVLGLYGFVFGVVFGKAYALLPAYFDRELATPRAPAVHLPLAVVGTVGLFAGVTGRPIWGRLGAIAPALLAVDFRGGALFRTGAVLQALAVVGFALAVCDMYYRTDRDRVGFHALLAGALCGVAAVALGLSIAFVGGDAGLLEAHVRLALGGFVGLTIVGVTYGFYPPAIGSAPGVDDRTALVSILLLAGGFAVEAVGHLAVDVAVGPGRILALVGALCYAYVLGALFLERR